MSGRAVHHMWRRTVVLGGLLALRRKASAQSLGTFRWRLQPFCNVVTVAVTSPLTEYPTRKPD